jgi:hypothetical protein
MITHVVLFNPGAAFSPDQRTGVLSALADVVASCPSVRGCRVGRRVRHGLPGYEQAMRENYDYALFLEFETLDGLREYLIAPAHARLGQIFSSGASASLAYDFEVEDLEGARRFV